MHEKINEVLEKIQSKKIREFTAEVVKKMSKRFEIEPAARGNHHARVGGLLEHSLSVALVGGKIADHFIELGYAINKDVVISGGLLHDAGKTMCYKGSGPDTKKGYQATDWSRKVHHIPIGVYILMSVAEDMKLLNNQDVIDIVHLIVSHHGRKDYGSSRIPMTPEAWICAHADFLDAYIDAGEKNRKIYGQ